jgi:hypothetical protein
MTPATSAPNAWHPPDPKEVPEWRNRILDNLSTDTAISALCVAIDHGKFSVVPTVTGLAGAVYTAQATGRHANPSIKASLGAVAAPLLAKAEADRLRGASLYFASADMTSLACAAASTPPTELFSERRLPADSGFMLFAEPIGGYTVPANEAVPEYSVAREGLALTAPIVAVSWSRWHAAMTENASGLPVNWYCKLLDNSIAQIPRSFDGVWLTFYTDASEQWDEIDPDEPVAAMPDGRILTAGQIKSSMGHFSSTPLAWDNETLVSWGADLSEPPTPDSTDQWVHVVYTAWQLMSQVSGNKPITEIDEVNRTRHGHKRDTRAGISGPPGVRVVRLREVHPEWWTGAYTVQAASVSDRS